MAKKNVKTESAKNTAKSSKTGRPKESIKDKIDLELVQRVAAMGFNKKQIAQIIGVSERTFYHYMKDDEFSSVIKQGSLMAVYEVSNKLYELCMDKNISAIKYFLNNRLPENWKENPEPSQASIDTTGVVELVTGLITTGKTPNHQDS